MSYKVHIDFETRSVAELARQNGVGEHAYAAHASTDPLLLAFKTPDMASVDLVDLTRSQSLPKPVERAIEAGATFTAHNARFEQAIWYWQMHKRFGWPLITHWSCTAARARYWGLRPSLDGAGSDLDIELKKDKRGDELMKLFSIPRKRVKGIVRQRWALPHELPSEWQEFKDYCVRDVEAEICIDEILPELPAFEQAAWDLDYQMGWNGLPLDIKLVRRAIEYCDYFTARAFERFDEITGGLRPTQRDKVLEYCTQREMDIDDLRKKTLQRLTMADFDDDLQEVVQIRLETSKASVKKLARMVGCATEDDIARGLIVYYGAHTGRDSAKRIQPQNFVRGDGQTQDQFFEYLTGPWWEDQGNRCHLSDPPRWAEVADLIFPRPLSALGLSMRGFIKAPEGERFVIADYAQIEARVNAWGARHERKLEAFRNKDDLYCRFAAVMYKRLYEDYFDDNGKVRKELAVERQVAKSAELGCGFGLGWAQFIVYCDNIDLIIDEATAKKTVGAWREDNQEIVQYWYTLENAAISAVVNEGKTYRAGVVKFRVHRMTEERYWLQMILPSGRHIAYFRPKVRTGLKWGKPKDILSFRTEWNGKTYREDTYGGKLDENWVQGCARDMMKVGVQNAVNAGYKFRLPVHDEGVFTAPWGFGSAMHLEKELCRLPYWIGDCPITAEGKECERYSK